MKKIVILLFMVIVFCGCRSAQPSSTENTTQTSNITVVTPPIENPLTEPPDAGADEVENFSPDNDAYFRRGIPSKITKQ
ncbi:MAG: hypothetical protein N3A54_03320 [Patescibacteria group bacterium]|nr:hypothetical protein [Patescibacteria group bacterium]